MIFTRKKWIDWFILGQFEILHTGHEEVLCYGYNYQHKWMVIVHNFSDQVFRFQLPKPQNGAVEIELNPFAYGWYNFDAQPLL